MTKKLIKKALMPLLSFQQVCHPWGHLGLWAGPADGGGHQHLTAERLRPRTNRRTSPVLRRAPAGTPGGRALHFCGSGYVRSDPCDVSR